MTQAAKQAREALDSARVFVGSYISGTNVYWHAYWHAHETMAEILAALRALDAEGDSTEVGELGEAEEIKVALAAIRWVSAEMSDRARAQKIFELSLDAATSLEQYIAATPAKPSASTEAAHPFSDKEAVWLTLALISDDLGLDETRADGIYPATPEKIYESFKAALLKQDPREAAMIEGARLAIVDSFRSDHKWDLTDIPAEAARIIRAHLAQKEKP